MGIENESDLDDKSPLTKCPICGQDVEQGTLSVHGTWLSFIFVGMSYQHCWFRGLDRKEQVIIGSGERTNGFRCIKCGFIGIYRSAGPPFGAPW